MKRNKKINGGKMKKNGNASARRETMMDGGMQKDERKKANMGRMMYKNGTTKSGKKKINPKEQPGLAKLKKKAPQVVAKMGYFKKGGKV